MSQEDGEKLTMVLAAIGQQQLSFCKLFEEDLENGDQCLLLCLGNQCSEQSIELRILACFAFLTVIIGPYHCKSFVDSSRKVGDVLRPQQFL